MCAGICGISSIMATKKPLSDNKTRQTFSDTIPKNKPDTSKYPKDTTSMPRVYQDVR